MNPGVARLAIVLALVVGGVAVLANGFEGERAGAAPPASPTPTPSPTPSPTPPPQDEIVAKQEGVLIQVLNGTNAPGLAADFQATLVDAAGYVPAGEAADAPEKPIVDSVVYFRRDRRDRATAQNRADAELLSREFLDGVPVRPLPAELESAVNEAADVVVVLGEDRAEAA